MIIGCERFGHAALPHHRKGDAVGQAPFLILVLAIQLQAPPVQFFRKWDDLEVRVSLDGVQQDDGRCAVAEFGERVADLQDDGAGSD
jgi:hypothetical protein